MRKITLNDIPKEEKDKFILTLSQNDKEYQKLLNKYAALRRALRLAEAARIKKQIEQHIQLRLDSVLVHARNQAVQMARLFEDMEENEIIEINTKINSIILLCDIIETFSMDINHIVKKYHPDYRVDMYDKFAELGKEARSQMKFMHDVSEDVYQDSFADVADNLQEMVINKAKALSRKIKKAREAKDND